MRFLILSLCLALVSGGNLMASRQPERPERFQKLDSAVRTYIATDALNDHYLLTDNETGNLRKLQLINIPADGIQRLKTGNTIVAANFRDSSNGDKVEVHFELDKEQNVARVRIHAVNNVPQDNE